MAATSPKNRNNDSDDNLDDLLNGIIEGREIPSTNDNQSQLDFTKKSSGTGKGGDGLGIDEEIIVTKKRIPIPKLDDNRLLSDPGIPRLRKISKERLRFKGKGHEYRDIARMLNMYQLWLDDLYPRAKFADALAMTEKVGHSKRMQMMRKDWIDEGKPRRTTGQDDDDADEIVPDAPPADGTSPAVESIERDADAAKLEAQAQGRASAADADPDEDELDALLAESAQSENAASKTLPMRTTAAEDDAFADEMEAMADMEDIW